MTIANPACNEEEIRAIVRDELAKRRREGRDDDGRSGRGSDRTDLRHGSMHYRSQFLIGLPVPPFIIGCMTFNPELMRLPCVPRGHCLIRAGHFALAVLVGIN